MALLPIASLRLTPDVVEGLRKLGFERVEQLIGEPRAPLAKRFGRTLHRRLDQALGFVAERIAALAVVGDDNGVARWREIAIQLERILLPECRTH